MQVVVIASQKGGSSKSTLSQCLAVEALKEGKRAAILDLDPQQSVAKWGQRRAANGIPVPAVVACAEKPVKAALQALQKQGAVIVVIDTPPLRGDA
jgi:chromosome partitioning protein